MEVRLIALPWPAVDHPPAALASLAPFIREHNPECRVENLYPFLDVMQALGRNFYEIYSRSDLEGELLYAGIYYPEKRTDVVQHSANFLEQRGIDPRNPDWINPHLRGDSSSWSDIADKLLIRLEDHLQELAQSVAGVDVIGLTTCFNQLFANLCFARCVKRLSPRTSIMFGGSTVSGSVGPSLVKEYPEIDYIVQGEGELPLNELIGKLRCPERSEMEPRAVLSRENASDNPHGVGLWEMSNLDDLEFPDYEGFAERADAAGIRWALPVEGSRGCWWDRTKRTNDVRAACFFCGLNVQWETYREKSAGRVGREVDHLSDRYANPVLVFVDNVMRYEGIEQLAAALGSHRRDYVIGHEVRANISPFELVRMWEAGLRIAEIGVDGLSSSCLRRLGKGTTTIQNLQAMKTVYELEIDNQGNLIVGFPGSEQQDVVETCGILLDHAFAYQPLNISEFKLSHGSTVDRLSTEFGACNVRNAELWGVGLPDNVNERLVLFDRDAEFPKTADWTPVWVALRRWRRAHECGDGKTKRRHLLSYLDGRSYLRIEDRRSGRRVAHTLRNEERLIYLRCSEITNIRELVIEFCGGGGLSEDRLSGFLEWALECKLMFQEDQKYLSLATAHSPQIAARRIKKDHSRRR